MERLHAGLDYIEWACRGGRETATDSGNVSTGADLWYMGEVQLTGVIGTRETVEKEVGMTMRQQRIKRSGASERRGEH